MMEVIIFPLVFLLSMLFSIYGTPVARNAGIQFRIVDRPDGVLKLHEKPIPYLGGLSIYISFLLALSLVFEFKREILGLLFGGSIISTLGLLDDIGNLSPRIKLIGEILAVYILIKSGIYIKLWFLPEYLAITITFLWMIGIINAFNLLDIMDGLSAGIAFISSMIFFIISIISENHTTGIISMALSGAILGFLNYNFNPATIFMGDSGSLFLGFILSSISIMLDYTRINKFAFIAPLLVLWVPIFETTFLFFTRLSKGISPFRGSRDHTPIRLKTLFNLSVKKTVGIFYILSFSFGILGILNTLFSFNFSLLTILLTIAFSSFFWSILLKAKV
ncbi:MAG: MraY family glycosyltransferase [Candidatus Aminicenantia bacterium]